MPRKPVEDEIEEAPEEEEEPMEEEEDEEASSTPPPEEAAPKPRRAKRPRRIGPPRRRESPWTNTEADYLWDEIEAAIASGNPPDPALNGATPYDIDIRVYASDDPARQLGSFNGALVTSTVAAGGSGQMGSERLRDEVIRRVHVVVTPAGHARYSVHFVRRTGGYKIFARGMLSLPSMDQLVSLRRAGIDTRTDSPAATWDRQGGNPLQGYPQPGFGQPAPTSSPEVAQLRADVGRLNGMLEQTLKALAEGRPVVAAPEREPPPPQPNAADQLLGAVKLLRELGVQVGAGSAPPPEPAAPVQVVQAQPGLVDASERLAGEVSAFGQVLNAMKQMRSYMRQGEAILGSGTSSALEAIDVDDPPPAEPEPKKPPFTTSDTGAKFSNGMPVMYAETPDGKWSPWGTVMSNPIIVEKTMEAVGPVLAAIAGGVGKKLGVQIPGVTLEEPAPASAPQRQSPPSSPQENGVSAPQRTGWPSM